MHDLIVFSHLRWVFVYQRPQHLLSRLARDRRVFYVEEPDLVTGPANTSTSTPVNTGASPAASILVSSPCPGVMVLRPRRPVDAAGFADAQLSVLEPLLRQWVADYGVRDAVAWFYTPMALPLLRAVPARAVVYDCMDELSAFDFAPPQMLRREAELLQRADVVLTGGPSLYDAKKSRMPTCTASPVRWMWRTLHRWANASMTAASPNRAWASSA